MLGLMLQKFEGIEKDKKEMLQRFEGMEKSLATIKESLSAREIGNRSYRAAIKRVFPAATKYTFFIRSFSNLDKLNNDPIISLFIGGYPSLLG